MGTRSACGRGRGRAACGWESGRAGRDGGAGRSDPRQQRVAPAPPPHHTLTHIGVGRLPQRPALASRFHVCFRRSAYGRLSPRRDSRVCTVSTTQDRRLRCMQVVAGSLSFQPCALVRPPICLRPGARPGATCFHRAMHFGDGGTVGGRYGAGRTAPAVVRPRACRAHGHDATLPISRTVRQRTVSTALVTLCVTSCVSFRRCS